MKYLRFEEIANINRLKSGGRKIHSGLHFFIFLKMNSFQRLQDDFSGKISKLNALQILRISQHIHYQDLMGHGDNAIDRLKTSHTQILFYYYCYQF